LCQNETEHLFRPVDSFAFFEDSGLHSTEDAASVSDAASIERAGTTGIQAPMHIYGKNIIDALDRP
jgi:hypothetical protein